MTAKPLVSLLIVNYNGRQLLPALFSSIERLDYPRERLEVIFVDDNSSDASVAFLRDKYPGIKIIENRKKLGPAGARNAGMLRARGEFVATLDNDVVLDPGWLKPLVEFMQGDANTGACASKLLFYDDKEVINGAGGIVNIYGDGMDRGIFQKDSGQYDKPERVFFACSAAMLLRRSVIERIGLFDGDYFYLYEDLDYCWRINLAGSKVVYVPSAAAYHGFSRTMKRDTLRVKYLLEKNRLTTLLKNYSLWTLARLSAGLLRHRFRKASLPREGGHPALVLFAVGLTAWLWNIANAGRIIKKRLWVQRHVRKIGDREIARLMCDGAI
ncbi:MAG: glycosyltransferase family 2 protein [Candidatus Omnitrophica bacterium]|nr:glycosyltransferase family 2 protein [Candidatus Omnitrophota bacterium]